MKESPCRRQVEPFRVAPEFECHSAKSGALQGLVRGPQRGEGIANPDLNDRRRIGAKFGEARCIQGAEFACHQFLSDPDDRLAGALGAQHESEDKAGHGHFVPALHGEEFVQCGFRQPANAPVRLRETKGYAILPVTYRAGASISASLSDKWPDRIVHVLF